jgi:hypothetical protein
LSLDHLFEVAEEVLTKQDFCIWILLDRLDVAFAECPDLEKTALRALFRAYLDLLAFRHIQFKIFLRSDIWARITAEGFREASHITRDLTISWNRSALLNLVVSRAIQNEAVQDYYHLAPREALVSLESQEALFYRMFPQKAVARQNSLESFEWMLSRTQDGTKQTAPRELIHLLSSLRETQIRQLETGEARLEGEALFDRSIFIHALYMVSRVRLEQTLLAELPQLRGFIESLRGKKVYQSIGSLSKAWHLPVEVTMTTAHHLVDAGFFEKRDTKDGTEYWIPYLYQEALNLVQGHADQVVF